MEQQPNHYHKKWTDYSTEHYAYVQEQRRQSPIDALPIEADETPLEIRRDKLSLMYWVKLKDSWDKNPAVKTPQSCWEYSRFQRRGFGWLMNECARTQRMDTAEFTQPTPVSSAPPWLYFEVKVDMSVLDMKKDWRVNEGRVKTRVYPRSNYFRYFKICTDGSKNTRGCGNTRI